MKSLWQWEKHDVVNYLRRANFLETEVEFTTESLIKKINKSKSIYYGFGYGDRVISKHLSDLATDGYLKVRYESVKMEPTYPTGRLETLQDDFILYHTKQLMYIPSKEFILNNV